MQVVARIRRDVTQTVESRISGKPFKASAYRLPTRQVLTWSLYGCVAIGFLLFLGRTAYRQNQALAQWEAVSPPAGDQRPGCGDPRMHTPTFWSVMDAFGLKHGNSPEDFVEVLGEPDCVEPVVWYCYIREPINHKGAARPEWIMKDKNAYTIEGYVKKLEGKRYTWKYDQYVYPRPKGIEF